MYKMYACVHYDEGNGGVGSCSYSKGRGFDDD